MTTANQGATPEAIRHHYDVSNEFYSLWLDESLTYTCALWEDPHGDQRTDEPAGPTGAETRRPEPAGSAAHGKHSDGGDGGDGASGTGREPDGGGATETLDSAQQRKLDHLILGAKAGGAGRVLDIGCGWGSLLDRLVKVYGVGHAVGLTLSDSQAEAARAASIPRTDVLLESWQEHQPEKPYDAIISIGAVEHFARSGLSRTERVACYREFFERCAEWLPSRGRIAIQTNIKGSNNVMDKATVRELMFIMERIFPESEIPALSEVLEGSEKLFDVVSLRNDPEHYSRTCREWVSRLRRNRERAVECAGEQTVADYEWYLGSSVQHFARRHLGLARIILEKGR